jgi:hypothetical protein
MNFGNDQKIESVNQSTIVQAKGDINFNGITAETAMEICKYVVKAELAVYTQDARVEAEKRLSDISEKTIDRITSLKEDLLYRFKEPAIQMALNETFKNHIASGNEELGENLIDLLIERLKVQERTTEQSIIDEARNIIPKLPSNTVSLLAIMVFSKLIFPYNKKQYDDLLLKLAPLAERLKNISSLDIAHLKQVGCGYGISAFHVVEPLEKHLLSNYDLFFRHNILLNELNDIFQRYPQLITNSLHTDLLYIMVLLFTEGQYASFNIGSTKTVTVSFNQANKDHLIPLFEDLKNKAIPFTEDEVRYYHIQKDSRWQFAFEIFKNEQITTFQLNPVGTYIGIRQLTKICERPIPMSLFYV